jgi:acetoin utilization deacetylase AcuC-like enzyme
MGRTALIFSPKYYQHRTGRHHPESAKRLRVILTEVTKGQLSKSKHWQLVEPQEASIKDVRLIHSIGYIRNIEKICRYGGGILDSGDTVVSRESFDVALYAAGGVLRAVNLVMEKCFENAFALVRPPGHHARKSEALGFCLINNIAIASEYLLRKFKFRRILIFDVDSHHGNGVQEAFYQTDDVLYISLHEDPREFPKTGFVDEVGKGRGEGYTVNVPLPFGTTDQIYLRAVNEIVLPIIHQYKPQFMLLCAGFDGHYTDPLGHLSLSAHCYNKIFEIVKQLASQICDGRLVASLEGGYSLGFVGKMVASAISQMSRSHYSLTGWVPISSRHVQSHGDRIINDVKKVQKSFWNID